MNQKYEKLKGLLQELFQLDQPDLDFGIYRIMHAKSAEVTKFLDEDLLPQVEAAFAQYKTADRSELETQYKRAVDQALSLIHISEPTRLLSISYAVFCLKKKNKQKKKKKQ